MTNYIITANNPKKASGIPGIPKGQDENIYEKLGRVRC